MIARRLLALALFLILFGSFACAQSNGGGDDPLLQAMRTEMDRSKAKLKLNDMQAPYYIEYSVIDMQQRTAEATFGALRGDIDSRIRFLRVVVRVGDYKQDSYYGQGQGVIDFVPLDSDVLAMRHQIWLATDRAYKAATAALTAKQAQLKQFTIDVPVDDFSKAPPIESIAPLVKSEVDADHWIEMMRRTSARYKEDPQIQSFNSALRFLTVNRYLLNSEGTVTRNGENLYEVSLSGTTQAADGMRLDRSWGYPAEKAKDLPSDQELMDRTEKLVAALKQLREAPVVDEDYRGPVLFSADAASSVFQDFVGENVLGQRPQLGQNARTRGAWATSFKTRVLPDFINAVDDPSLTSAAGKDLLGHYEIDDEGVKASKVSLIEGGKLVNYLVGREPIRDFPTSNGHARAQVPVGAPNPALGNLIITAKDATPAAEMKKKLIEMCKQRDLAYGYYVETMGPLRSPRLIYRVDVKDGKEQLVRGAVFGDLDARALRNDLVAAGDDVNVDNRIGPVPHSIVNPSILFDELEVKRTNTNKEKLPEYPPPPLQAAK